MQVIIDIPEHTFNYIHNGGSTGASLLIENAIKNGTQLLEEHGRLIDVDEALREWKNVLDFEIDHPKYQCTIRDVLEGAPVIVEAGKIETPSKTEMALGRGKEMKDEYEYKMSIPVSGRLDAHVISETPLTKEEVMQRAFESANFGELEDCDINHETDIDELYFEGEDASEERGDYK